MKSKQTKYDKEWLESQVQKDNQHVENYKRQIIESLKTIDKTKIFEQKKLTLWQRIKTVLGF
jgi:hypothetical protein